MTNARWAWTAMAALVLGATAADRSEGFMVPLGTQQGGAAVYYNDNGNGERPSNVAYVRAQFSATNTNGAVTNFDTTPLAGSGGISFFDLFQVVPDQFGLDLVLRAPTSDGTVPTPASARGDEVASRCRCRRIPSEARNRSTASRLQGTRIQSRSAAAVQDP